MPWDPSICLIRHTNERRAWLKLGLYSNFKPKVCDPIALFPCRTNGLSCIFSSGRMCRRELFLRIRSESLAALNSFQPSPTTPAHPWPLTLYFVSRLSLPSYIGKKFLRFNIYELRLIFCLAPYSKKNVLLTQTYVPFPKQRRSPSFLAGAEFQWRKKLDRKLRL